MSKKGIMTCLSALLSANLLAVAGGMDGGIIANVLAANGILFACAAIACALYWLD